MNLKELHNHCNIFLSSDKKTPVTKVEETASLVRKILVERQENPIKEGIPDNQKNPYGNTDTDFVEVLTDLANQIRTIIRHSAWGQEHPISAKQALKKYVNFSDTEWQQMETFINHERDFNWNYLNLVDTNLRFNILENKKDFGLSPQHFRLFAIINFYKNQFKDSDLDIDQIKNIYRREDQIPRTIQKSIREIGRLISKS